MTSTAVQEHAAVDYASQPAPEGCGQLLFFIEDVTEGIALQEVSQYPRETEWLLPMMSCLRLTETRENTEGNFLEVHCSYVGTVMSEEFAKACIEDLQNSQFQLIIEAKKAYPRPDMSTAFSNIAPPPLEEAPAERDIGPKLGEDVRFVESIDVMESKKAYAELLKVVAPPRPREAASQPQFSMLLGRKPQSRRVAVRRGPKVLFAVLTLAYVVGSVLAAGDMGRPMLGLAAALASMFGGALLAAMATSCATA